MILLVEPIAKNIGMVVPAYPLPVMEVGSFVKSRLPKVEIKIVSIPVDYGLPLTAEGKEKVYQDFLKDFTAMNPRGVGISCTAIAQAEEVIQLCEQIKARRPDCFTFMGGYFPTLYHEEIFLRTDAVDMVVRGEGEWAALKVIELLEAGKDPRQENVPGLSFKKDGRIHHNPRGPNFDLNRKVPHNLTLLKYIREYSILPYAFSRGCPYKCAFCMEEFIRPVRKEVPRQIIQKDLTDLAGLNHGHTLLVSDALFKSFDLFPLFRSLNLKVNFETRCDVLDPSLIREIADVCGSLALGLESASFRTLSRMNKVRDQAHYRKYLDNALAIFREAVKYEIPVMVFMIAGYPGDRAEDLEESLAFARELTRFQGPGGHIFKIGECRVYPKTKLYDQVRSMPEVVFDDDGVFGQNIVREPSRGLPFEVVLDYMDQIFRLSHLTPRLIENILKIVPFFRLPGEALMDPMIPDICFKEEGRHIFNLQSQSLDTFRALIPALGRKYSPGMSGERSTRSLSL